MQLDIYDWFFLALYVSYRVIPVTNTRKIMEFTLKHNAPENSRSGCLIVTVAQPRKLSPAGKSLDKAAKGFLGAVLKRGDMDGKAGQTL